MIDAKLIDWKGNNGVAEASELRLRGFPHFLDIKGRTATLRFVNNKVIKNREGEILSAEYSNIKGFSLTIFND